MSDGESGEFWYAYHAYHANGMTPSTYADLPKHERAIIMAFIDIRIKQEEKAAKRAKRK